MANPLWRYFSSGHSKVEKSTRNQWEAALTSCAIRHQLTNINYPKTEIPVAYVSHSCDLELLRGHKPPTNKQRVHKDTSVLLLYDAGDEKQSVTRERGGLLQLM